MYIIINVLIYEIRRCDDTFFIKNMPLFLSRTHVIYVAAHIRAEHSVGELIHEISKYILIAIQAGVGHTL